ncbi:alpha-1,4-glucan--maltose-1-phosphate maltosyltransferase [Neomicrococcus aestuarii]|uniref:Alpha-1,4-glucan:maltose-1-phosphate maltosyltransferase n=1 Tax=Neomicrococcus aestuarii TaxID=556325 RepID=A0A1L2ZNP3_9MICC|nr:alpha-1,4-glucan--maltose-1-phosphate maltosyltransferase [Neomicrococcus aestuarii]APF40652.1 alpha-1,4-glucan--maltose-1-phosphate maltosyltransferase [Neomicrococcus aestuarii]MBB5512357.1 starch synthase (maltosyl-transferring) [Neomicrococcus aestuarii]
MSYGKADYGRIPVTEVQPAIDGGKVPAKAFVGEEITVSAVAFREGHDQLGVSAVLYDPHGRERQRVRLRPGTPGLDQWHGSVRPDGEGVWEFEIEAWDSPYDTWVHDAGVKIAAGVDVDLMLQEGIKLLSTAADDAASYAAEPALNKGAAALEALSKFVGNKQSTPESAALLPRHEATLREAVQGLSDTTREPLDRYAAGVAPEIKSLMDERPLRRLVTYSGKFPLNVERVAAGHAAWYEFFPRSEGAVFNQETGTFTSGNFRTAAKSLDRVADMGFNVIYMPPIHPIGRAHRKGPNNTLNAGEFDPGSPWAIGSPDGGHDAIHPELGTVEDFEAFVARAHELGLEVALDLALQASPDHPWVTEHPEWFTTRVDGTIAYAENPPKKYQDIFPINFDNDPKGIYKEVLRIVKLWIDRGVKIFRVDNPHTKPLQFWEWLIRKVNKDHPEVLFLAEAFTRPAMMGALGKAGFQQSYTYFTWRNTKEELYEYLQHVSQESPAYFRPNFWVNTPDILTEYLQYGGQAAFKIRAILAATATPLWGMYAGYELCEHVARPGAEEYIDNEKYEFKNRDFAAAEAEGRSIIPLIRRLNEIRAAHPALGDLRTLRLHDTSDDATVAFSKTRHAQPHGVLTDASGVVVPAEKSSDIDTVIVLVNTDSHYAREGQVHLDLSALDLRPEDLTDNGTFLVDDLLSGETWEWSAENYYRLDPHVRPAHILSVRRGIRG